MKHDLPCLVMTASKAHPLQYASWEGTQIDVTWTSGSNVSLLKSVAHPRVGVLRLCWC